MQAGNVYMLIEREFIRLEQDVYKIGKTSRSVNKRVAQYPKESEIIINMWVKDITAAENWILQEFRTCFQQRLDFGREYFSGDVWMMIEKFKLIVSYVNNENQTKLLESKDFVRMINQASQQSQINMQVMEIARQIVKDKNVSRSKRTEMTKLAYDIIQESIIKPKMEPIKVTEPEPDVIYLGEIEKPRKDLIDLTGPDDDELERRIAQLKF